MKIIAFLLSLAFLSTMGLAQTKSIYAKRHEASHFVAGFDHVETNLGMAPERWVRHSELKKVTKINDSMVVMETNLSCEETFSRQQSKWSPGQDTTFNHPIFTADISVDSMRRILEETYFFENDMAQVRFEGFEKDSKPKSQPGKKIDERTNLDTKNQSDETKPMHKKRSKWPMSTWVLIIVLLSSAAGATQLK